MRTGRVVRAAVFAFTIFLLILLWGGLAIQLGYDQQQTLDRARSTSANLSATFAEYTVGVMRAMDQTLLSVKQDYEKDPERFDAAAEVQKYAVLRDISLQLGLIGPDGNLAFSSLDKSPEPVYLGDREHFVAHVGGESGKMFISRPMVGRLSGRLSLQLSRRLDRPDGSFAGVVVISLDPQYLANLFNSASLGRDGFVSLVGRDDMFVRARTSDLGTMLRRSMAGTELPRMLERSPTGVYEVNSAIDGVDRVLGYHAVPDYPLVIVVGWARDAILADFYDRRRWLGLVGMVISMVFAGAGLLFIRQVDRQTRTERELRRQAVELNESRMEAETANRAKSQFLANMSHELRTPLNAIIGFSELILSGSLGPIGSPKYLEYAGDIHASGTHLLDLINGILDMSKIEAGRYDLAPEEIDLAPVVEECLGFIRVRATEGGVALDNLRRADRLRVRADKRALKQILINLQSNAVKFTPRGGCVSIAATRTEDGMVAIEVADTGIGIAAADLKRIFEPFQQADNSLGRAHEGTGLGLTIAKSLVELNGGTLLAASAVGVGTTITVRLPAADDGSRRPPAPAGEELHASS